METLLERALALLEESSVRYCLLRHSHECRPSPCLARECDLLVAQSQLQRLAETLHPLGFLQYRTLGYAPHHVFLGYDATESVWIKLDVVTEIRFGSPIRALELPIAEEVLKRRERRGGLYIASPAHEFVLMTLHCILDKHEFRPAHQYRLYSLASALRSWPEVLNQELQCLDPELRSVLAPLRLMRQVLNSDWESLLAHRRALARALYRRDPIRSTWRLGSQRFLRRLNPVRSLLQRRGMLVVLIAPDGAGKSTIASQLALDPFLKASVLYMGGNAAATTAYLPWSAWLRRNLHRRRFQGRNEHWLRTLASANRLIEECAQLMLAFWKKLRGRVVVFDRFWYDAWLNHQEAGTTRRLRNWLLRVGSPTPDVVILLDASGDVLYSRKQEHTPEWLEVQRQRYKALQLHLPQMVSVDATRNLAEVRSQVTSLIWQKYIPQSH
jgi:thymidylate kinase